MSLSQAYHCEAGTLCLFSNTYSLNGASEVPYTFGIVDLIADLPEEWVCLADQISEDVSGNIRKSHTDRTVKFLGCTVTQITQHRYRVKYEDDGEGEFDMSNLLGIAYTMAYYLKNTPSTPGPDVIIYLSKCGAYEVRVSGLWHKAKTLEEAKAMANPKALVKKTSELVEILIVRDEMTWTSAIALLKELKQRVAEGEDPEELLMDELQLEPDYVMDLL